MVRDVGKSIVAMFSVLVKDNIKTANDREIEKLFYADCKCWDTGGRLLASKFKKDSLIEVEGMAETESYENKDGQKVVKTRFRVGHFWAVDGSGNRVSVGDGPAESEEPDNNVDGGDDDEAVPF